MDLAYVNKVNKLCFYDGKSVLNGEDILGFLYYGTNSNRKVKHYHYTVYIPKEVNQRAHSGSVCGECPLLKQKLCYTMSHMELPYYKWRQAYLKGEIEKVESFKEIKAWLKCTSLYGLRLGMHGDPASVPFEVTEKLLEVYSTRIIGYTHQYSHPNYDKRYNFLMQSTDGIEEVIERQKEKVRTARIISNPKEALRTEIVCPYDLEKYMHPEYPTKIDCGNCRLCSIHSQANIAFLPKGSVGKKPKLVAYLEEVNTPAKKEMRVSQPRAN